MFLATTDPFSLLDSVLMEQFGGTFYRPNKKQTSIIHLTYEAGFQYNTWGKWRYLESTGSDHEAIAFQEETLSSSSFLTPNKTPEKIFNLNRANWAKFADSLRAYEPQCRDRLEVAIHDSNFDEIALILESFINQASQNTIPLARPTARSKPWQTADLTALRHEYYSVKRRAKKYCT